MSTISSYFLDSEFAKNTRNQLAAHFNEFDGTEARWVSDDKLVIVVRQAFRDEPHKDVKFVLRIEELHVIEDPDLEHKPISK